MNVNAGLTAWIERACMSRPVRHFELTRRERDPLTGRDRGEVVDEIDAKGLECAQIAERLLESGKADADQFDGEEARYWVTVYLVGSRAEPEAGGRFGLRFGERSGVEPDRMVRTLDFQERTIAARERHLESMHTHMTSIVSTALTQFSDMTRHAHSELGKEREHARAAQIDRERMFIEKSAQDLNRMKFEREGKVEDLLWGEVRAAIGALRGYASAGPDGTFAPAAMAQNLAQFVETCPREELEKLLGVLASMPPAQRLLLQPIVEPLVKARVQKEQAAAAFQSTQTVLPLPPAQTNGANGHGAAKVTPEAMGQAIDAALTLNAEQEAQLSAWYDTLSEEQRKALEPVMNAYVAKKREAPP